MRFDCIHCRKATTKPQSVKGAFLRMLTLDSDLSFICLCETLGNVATELIVQPHQAIVSSAGGGTSNEQGWRDDKNKDNQRNEPFYKTSKRRR